MAELHPLLRRLGLETPILQAPMAGVSTPAMAAAVSNAGALGALGLGSSPAEVAAAMLAEVRGATNRAVNANVFVHAPAPAEPDRERAWIARFAPEFARLGAAPPTELREIYTSFAVDDAMLRVLADARPAVVSLHFGLPSPDRLVSLREAGALLLAGVTNLDEARAAERAGVDAVVAQGWEAGGHRGVFDPAAPDGQLGTLALTRLLVRELELPVIAAGGIMDGAGIAAALKLGAVAAQLGTAFVLCPESQADAGYRAAMRSPATHRTAMTAAVSGRPARALAGRFTALDVPDAAVPAYPRTYDLGKALHAAARAQGEWGWGAYWAGQGAPLARELPAGGLVAVLARELEQALAI